MGRPLAGLFSSVNLQLGDVQLAVVHRAKVVDHLNHQGCGSFDPRPAGGRQNEDRDAAALKVLLVAEVRIRRDQQLKALLLSQSDQITIRDRRPAFFVGGTDQVSSQEATEGSRCSLIKKNAH